MASHTTPSDQPESAKPASAKQRAASPQHAASVDFMAPFERYEAISHQKLMRYIAEGRLQQSKALHRYGRAFFQFLGRVLRKKKRPTSAPLTRRGA